jgi:subtilisin
MRDFEGQAVRASGLHGADSIVFPEIGVAVMSSAGLEATRSISTSALGGSDTPFLAVEPEHFVFAEQSPFLRGFLAAANAIAQELEHHESDFESAESPARELPGFTWGLIACRVPKSRYDGRGIKLAILDTGIDLGHPDFSGRHIVSESFISGQGVQDLHGHGTHCAGTAAGPSRPTGTGTRYGVASAASLYVGKVLSNAGNGTDQTVLAGMN